MPTMNVKRGALLQALAVGHAAAEAGLAKPLTDTLLLDIAARGRRRAETARP